MMMRFVRTALALACPPLMAACAADDALDHGPSVRAALDAQRLAPPQDEAAGAISSRELEPAMSRHLERRPAAPPAQR